jgi:hypothetical protein
MKDCSHYIKPKYPAWDMFQRFVQSPKGAEWLAKALQEQKKREQK